MTTNDSSPSSKPVSRRQRFEILRRDGYTCRYCGARAPDVHLHVDHVIPRTLGGLTEPSNLITACRDCNNGKGSTSPDERIVEDVDERARDWASAMATVAQMRRDELRDMNERIDAVATHWNGYTNWRGDSVPMGNDWETSLERFFVAGLDVADLNRIVRVAMNSKARYDGKWKYFCGCAWNEIKRRQEMAAAIVADAPEQQRAEGQEWDGDLHIPSYQSGIEDGGGWERIREAYQLGLSDGRQEAEDAYHEGFRRGAERLTNYRSSDLDDES